MFDQTMGQQPMYGAPMNNMGGYNYAGFQQQIPKVMNVLSADEIKELQQHTSQFTLGLTEREIKQAACNHRSMDGMSDSLTYDQETGIARCTICGYEFKPVDPDSPTSSIKEACDAIVDILQTSKIMYVDLPANAAREYYQIIPLIEKLPQLFEFAAKNFAKHDFNSWNYNNHNMGGVAMLQNLNNMYGTPVNAQPMMQPGMGMPQQPMMGAAPGYPQAAYNQPMNNGFGFQGASMQQPAYQPMNNGFAYNPPMNAPVAPTVAAPAAPAETTTEAPAADTTVTQTVNV